MSHPAAGAGPIAAIKARVSLEDFIADKAGAKFVRRGHRLECLCPFHKEKTPSFSVWPDTQTWKCFGSCGTGGDLIAFAMRFYGEDFKATVERLSAEAGLGDSEADRAAAEKWRRRREEQARERAEADAREMEKGRAIWRAARNAAGSPVEAYWRARGIAVPLPPTFRWDRLAFWHVPDGGDPRVLGTFDAMIAPVTDAARRVVAAHITYLDRVGGRWTKARVPDPENPGEFLRPKKIRGRKLTGAIRFSAATALMVMGEGPETTASGVQALAAVKSPPDWAAGRAISAWCGVDLPHMAGPGFGAGAPHPNPPAADPHRKLPPVRPDFSRDAIAIPDAVEVLVLLRDGDSGDPPSADAMLERAARRHSRPGRRVLIADPGAGVDFNDLYQPEG